MCGALLAEGKGKGRSAIVDHLRPIALRPELTFDPDNCRAVCRDCHGICASLEARYPSADGAAAAKLRHRPVGLDGYPVAQRRRSPESEGSSDRGGHSGRP